MDDGTIRTHGVRPHPAADPKCPIWETVALRLVGADPLVVRDVDDLRDVLRGFQRLPELLAAPGRLGAGLELSVDRGVLAARILLSAGGATSHEARSTATSLARAVRSALCAAGPYLLQLEGAAAARLPAHAVRIRQGLVTVSDGERRARAPTRFELPADTWDRLVTALDRHGQRTVLRTALLSTTLQVDDLAELDREVAAARAIVEAHRDELLGIRAARVLATLADVAESLQTPVLIADVLVGSDEPLDEVVVRGVATALTTELDVVALPERPDLATATVAARRRFVGGFDIEAVDERQARRVFRDNQPAVGDVVPRGLADLVTATEAPLLVRLPVPVGGPLPSVSSLGPSRTPKGPQLTTGLVVGRDWADRRLALPDGHVVITGLTGSMKSSMLGRMVRSALVAGWLVLLVDGHGTLARQAAVAGREAGVEVHLFDGESDRLRVLDHAGEGPASERQARLLAQTLASPWLAEMAGPVFFHAMSGGLLGLAHVPGAHPLAHVPDLFDRDTLAALTAAHPGARRALRPLQWGRDQDGFAGYVTAKADALAGPGCRRLVAEVGNGTALDEIDRGLVAFPLGGDHTAEEARVVGAVVLRLVLDRLRRRGGREPVLLVVDEPTVLDPDLLSEVATGGRKFGVRLAVAFQHEAQFAAPTLRSLLDNATSRVAFRTAVDARSLHAQLGVEPSVLRSLPDGTAVVGTRADGASVTTTLHVDPLDLLVDATTVTSPDPLPPLRDLLPAGERPPQL